MTDPRQQRQPAVSLLWPGGSRPATSGGHTLTPEAVADFQLAEIVHALALAVGDGRHGRRDRREQFARATLMALGSDPAVVAYRQDVVADLIADPALCQRLGQTLPGLDALAETASFDRYKPSSDGTMARLVGRLADLEVFVDAARRLADALAPAPLRSVALEGLRQEAHAITTTPTFQALEAELPVLRATLTQVKSVTVGINLTADLVPESATILAFSSERVEGRRGLLGRALGGQQDGRGISPLQRGSAASLKGPPNDLVRDLDKLLQDSAAPVAEALERYASVSTAALARLGPELALVIGAVRLVERLARAGLPMCRPDILPLQQRAGELAGAYDLGLALRLHPPEGAEAPGGVVTNAVTFDPARGQVWILTGPNRAGKTTYTRAVGQAHILFQAGLPVPATSARLSPVDAIYTHFPTVESARLGMGRLDEEAERLAEIFRRATPWSLILLNEALAGTSTLEAFGLARGAVRGLRLLGARAIYVTHLHELAAAVDEINATTPGSGTVASLVAEIEDEGKGEGEEDSVVHGPPQPRRRSFRVRPGPPLGQSYASDIAEAHGISFPRLAQLLQDRGVVPPPPPRASG